jgi:RNA polymerase sigma-B factor
VATVQTIAKHAMRSTDDETVLQRACGPDDDQAGALLTLLAELPAGHPDRPVVRERLILLYLPLARYFARRMCHRDESLEDLHQVASIGLIKSVDGYDISRGVPFTVYAAPTIVGEIKRYFRDKGWSLRVPRRLQELRTEIMRARGDLAQSLGTEPSVARLAEHLGVTPEEILAGMEVSTAYRAVSLQTLVSTGTGDAIELGELLGGDDTALEAAEARLMVGPLLAKLAPRERRMMALRFVHHRTQAEIADELGISQMHVSRLLTKVLAGLRTELMATA